MAFFCRIHIIKNISSMAQLGKLTLGKPHRYMGLSIVILYADVHGLEIMSG